MQTLCLISSRIMGSRKKMNILTKARNILGWVSNRIKSFLNKTANKQKRR